MARRNLLIVLSSHLVVVDAELHEFGEALVRKAHEMVEDAARRRGQGHEVEAVENLRVLGNGGACHRVVILPWSVRPKSVWSGGWALSLPPRRDRRRRVGHGLIVCETIAAVSEPIPDNLGRKTYEPFSKSNEE
jgi:hypothetical protein